jgi:hypothetical protein
MEIQTYFSLKILQESIANCYGSYYTIFPDRDLEDDRTVNILLLEYLEGMELETVDPLSTFPSKERRFAKNILDIAKGMYANDVYCRLELSNFRIPSKNHRSRIHCFSLALGTNEPGDGQRIKFRKRELAILEYDLDYMGFSLKGNE